MHKTTPRYKVTFDGWLYTEEIDICIDCFKRIADEIRSADTPQTDLSAEEFVEGMKNLKMEVKRTDCDRYAIVNDEGERAYNCIGCQTDCPWK